jgi:cyclase
LKQITSNIYVETENLGSNNSIIVTDEGLVLIDAPHKPTDAKAWREKIDALGKTAYLIHTDHHIDHTLGNFLLPGTIISHRETREQLKEHYASPEFIHDLLSVIDPEGLPLMHDFSLRLPEVTFDNKLQLYLGGVNFELTHLKGHTHNSIIIYLPDQKVLFSGDNVCEAGLPSFQEACVRSWLETIDHILTMDFEYVVPGHGVVGTKETVKVFRDQVRNLVGQVEEAIKSGFTKEEAAQRIRFEDKIHIGNESYNGYPDHLLESFQQKSVHTIYDQLMKSL